MIVIRGAAGVIREARCTNCWPDDVNEGILCVPDEISLDGDGDDGFDAFVESLIEMMSKPLPEGAGHWFPRNEE